MTAVSITGAVYMNRNWRRSYLWVLCNNLMHKRIGKSSMICEEHCLFNNLIYISVHKFDLQTLTSMKNQKDLGGHTCLRNSLHISNPVSYCIVVLTIIHECYEMTVRHCRCVLYRMSNSTLVLSKLFYLVTIYICLFHRSITHTSMVYSICLLLLCFR